MNQSDGRYQPYLNSLDQLGFCVLPVFEQKEIEQLKELYAIHFDQKKVEGLYATHNSNPVGQALQISRDIKGIVADKLQAVFPEYEYFLGHFMIKGPNVNKEFALHQDWNIVDESKYRSYQIWIPLQFTYPANGGMFVVPGSHHFFNNYRSGSYGIPVVADDERTGPITTDIVLPAGHVLIYHNALFHASYGNSTDQLRMAVIVNFVEKQAPKAYFHKSPDLSGTELYTVTGDSLIANLPELEKGIVASDLPLQEKRPLQLLDNHSICSKDLEEKYRKQFGKVNGSELKQLHIAKQQELEDELNLEGYKVIDLLNPDEVELFKSYYISKYAGLDRSAGRFTTLQNVDVEEKRTINDFIVKNITPILNKYFKDYLIPIALYYTKKAHTSGDIDLHADTTLLLNHQLEPHYAIWVPLLDVDGANGTLTVIPRSHLVKKAFFGGSLGGYHNDHLDYLRKHEVQLNLKAGQAVIFDNNLLHNSTANTTSNDRICFTLRITHLLSNYYSFLRKDKNGDSFEVYEEQHDYYMDHAWDGDNKVPIGKYQGEMLHSISKIEGEKLQQIIEGS